MNKIKEMTVLKEDVNVLNGAKFNIYGTNESPLFLAADVANLIEYNINKEGKVDASAMLRTVDEDEKVKVYCSISNPTISPKPSVSISYSNKLFLTEDGLYEVLMKSNKPIAKKFKKEVKLILKHIRRTGGYVRSGASEEFVRMYFPSLSETEVAFMSKQLEENRVLQAQIIKKDSQIVELIDNFKPGTTIYDSVLQLNGVKQRGALAHLLNKKYIKKPSQTWSRSDDKLFLCVGYLPTGKTRSWFKIDISESDEPVASTRKSQDYYVRTYGLTLTQVGMSKLYNLYKAEKLPMLANWDGKFNFVNASIAVEQAECE